MKRKYTTGKQMTHVKMSQYMVDHHLTQAGLAKTMGVTTVCVHCILRGKRRPDAATLILLEEATEGYLTIKDFYGEDVKYALL